MTGLVFADTEPSTGTVSALIQGSCHTMFMASRLGEPG